MPTPLKIFFDGGYRPHDGGMEFAVVVRGRVHLRTGLGEGSSMAAEWLALLDAVRLWRELGTPDAVLLGDSAGVVARAGGAARARAADAGYLAEYRALTADGAPRLRRVKRSQNLAGIALERRRALGSGPNRA